MTATLAERPTVVAVGEQEPTHWCPQCNGYQGAACTVCGGTDHHVRHDSEDESIHLRDDITLRDPHDDLLVSVLVGLSRRDTFGGGVCGGRTRPPLVSFLSTIEGDRLGVGYATPDEADQFARHILFFTACAHGLTITEAAALADATLAQFRQARAEAVAA